MNRIHRRRVLKDLGISAAALPFIGNLSSLLTAGEVAQRAAKKRLIIMFSPNGIVPKTFWPDETGQQFALKEILSPLEPYKDRMLVLKGISNKVRGDGDSHMRGMSCLLTGIELFPGNIQGGSHTPAGWASGISIDQEIKNFLQSRPETETRFGSLEFGVLVGDRADPWTRMVYAGPNQPIAPISDPYQMFDKLFGRVQDQQLVSSVLDEVLLDLRKVSSVVGKEDRQLLEEHTDRVREMERDLKVAREQKLEFERPELPQGIRLENDNMPDLSRKMQIDLLVSAMRNDMARVATLQFTKSVGGARMKWLGVDESHHSLSHEPDSNEKAQEQLTKINKWFCEQLAYLTKSLAETPEPGASGSMLDHTTIVWTNELGKGNSHTLDNIPYVLIGEGLGFNMGRSLNYKNVPHNRLLLAYANAFGHELNTFGNKDLSSGGVLSDLG